MPKQEAAGDLRAEDEALSRKIEESLACLDIQARVVHVTHGPAIVRFELEVAAGTRMGKFEGIDKALAFDLSCPVVTVQAPIPGKSLVGISMLASRSSIVTLREVLQTEKMQEDHSLLTVALGKDDHGVPVLCNLGKMPHLLIAGQTGSGKSCCLHAMIVSLLYRATPDEVKMIIIDPAVVEMSGYNGIPHLLMPVLNDSKKAVAALAWVFAEMMERFSKFTEMRERSIESYNRKMSLLGYKPMARLVVFINEIRDLIADYRNDTEEYIVRLTQMGRPVGIHLVVATQVASDVNLSWTMRNGFPSRIAFKTADSYESKAILNGVGAEKLRGCGDFLNKPAGASEPTRVWGCFLTSVELNRVTTHVRQANPSIYDPDILEKMDQLLSGNTESSTDFIVQNDSKVTEDGLFERAVEFALQDGQLVTSTLQRRLKTGYALAGRLMDQLGEKGIVSAKDGSKPRRCLITREQWEEMKKTMCGG